MRRARIFAIHSAGSSCSVNNMENVDNEENNEDNIRRRSDCNNLAFHQGPEWSAWNYDDSQIRYSKSNEQRVNRSCHSNCNTVISNNCPRGKHDDGQFNGGYECEHNQEVDWNIWSCASPEMNCIESDDRHIGRRYGWNCDKETNLLTPQKATTPPITGNMSHQRIKNCRNSSPLQVNESVMDHRAIVRPTYSNESLNSRSITWLNNRYQSPEISSFSRRQQSRQESRQPRMRQYNSFYPSDLPEFTLDYNNDLHDYTRSKNESLPRRKRGLDKRNDCHQQDETFIPNVRPWTSKWRHRSRNRDSHKRMPSGTRVGFQDRSRKCRRADKQRRKNRCRETTDCPLMTITNWTSGRSRDNINQDVRTAEWNCSEHGRRSRGRNYSPAYDPDFYRSSDRDRDASNYRQSRKYPEYDLNTHDRWETDSHASEKCHSVCDCCSTASLRSRKSGRSFDSDGLRRKKSVEAIRARKRGKRRELQRSVDGPDLIDSATGSKVLLASLNCESCKCRAVAGGDEVLSSDAHARNCTPSKASMFVEASGSVDSKRSISTHELRASEASISSKNDGEKVKKKHLDLAISMSKSKVDRGKDARIRGCSERCSTRPIYIENPNQFYDSVSMENVDSELDYEWKRKVKMKDAYSTTSITLKEKQKYRPNRIKSSEAIRVQSSETVAIRKRESRQMAQTASQTSQTRIPGFNQQSNPRDRLWWLEVQAGRIWNRVHDTCRDLIKLAVTNFGQAMQEVPRPRRFARQAESVHSTNLPDSTSPSTGNARPGESRWKSFARSKLPWNRKTLDRRDGDGQRWPAGVKRSCQTGTECITNFYGADASTSHRDRVPKVNPEAPLNYDRQRDPNFGDAECSHCRTAAKYYPSDGRSCLDPPEGSGQKDVYLQSSSGEPFSDLKHQKYPGNRDRGGTDDNGDFPGQEEYNSNLFSYDFLSLDENSGPNSEVNGAQPTSQEFQDPRSNQTQQMFPDNIDMNLEWMEDLGQVERVRGGSDPIDMWPTQVREGSDPDNTWPAQVSRENDSIRMFLERMRGGSDSKDTSPRQTKRRSDTEDMSPEARKMTLNNKPDASKKSSPCWSAYKNRVNPSAANADCKKIRDEMLEILCKENKGAYNGKLKCPPREYKESNEQSEFYENRSRGGSDSVKLSQAEQMETDVCVDEYNTKIYERTQECRKRWMSLISYNSSNNCANGVSFSKYDESDAYNLFSKSDFEAMSKSRIQKQNLNPFSVTQPKWCLKRSITNDQPFINCLENRNRGGSDRAKVAKKKEKRPSQTQDANESDDFTTSTMPPGYSTNNKRLDKTICINSDETRHDMSSMTDSAFRPMTCRTVGEQSVQTPQESRDGGPKLSVSGTNERVKKPSDAGTVKAPKPEIREPAKNQTPMRKKADPADVKTNVGREHVNASEMNKDRNKSLDFSNGEDDYSKKLSASGSSPDSITICVPGSKFREYQVSPSEENKVAWAKMNPEECPGMVETPSKTDETKTTKKKVDRPRVKSQNGDTTKVHMMDRNLKKERSATTTRHGPPSAKPSPKSVGKPPAKPVSSTFSSCISKDSRYRVNDLMIPPLPGKSSSTLPKSEDSRKIESKKSKTRPPPRPRAQKSDAPSSGQTQRKTPVRKKLKPTKSKSSSSSSSSTMNVQCEMKPARVQSKTPKVSAVNQMEEPRIEPRTERRVSKDVDSSKAASAMPAKMKEQKPKTTNVVKDAVSDVKGQAETKRSSKTPAPLEIDALKRTPNSPKAQIVREHDKGTTHVNVEIQTSNTILTQILSEFEFGDKKRRIVMSIKLETDPDEDDVGKDSHPGQKRDSASSKEASHRVSKQSESPVESSDNRRIDSNGLNGSPGADIESEGDDNGKNEGGKEESADESSQREPNAQEGTESPLNGNGSSRGELNYDSDISGSIKDSDMELENPNDAPLSETPKPPAAVCTNTAKANGLASGQYDQCSSHQCVQTLQEPQMVDAYTSTPQGAILKKHIRANSTCGGLCGRTMS